MSRVHDVLYFLCQIFFPHWAERKEDAEPTRLQKITAVAFRLLTSRDGTGAFFSIILHLFILAILALIMVPQLVTLEGINILGGVFIPGEEPGAMIALPGDPVEDNGAEQNVAQEDPTDELVPDDSSVSTSETVREPDDITILSDAAHMKAQRTGGFAPGGGFENRTPGGRQGGGTNQKAEGAVERALVWLAFHQNKTDGGWSLKFEDSCKTCSHGSIEKQNRRTAATALALLAFLGAGYSHTEGPYQTEVKRGLDFLRINPSGGYDGAIIQNDPLQMYSRGLAAMALCEAYAMNKEQDPTSALGLAAQRSLWFIETAQDTDYGGWNYRPDQIYRREKINDVRQQIRIGGDMSIFSWQLMALKSGKIGGLHVSQSTLYAAQDFLDLLTLDGGRQYNYIQIGGWDKDRGQDSPQTCTAIGLLMRMYLGWKQGDQFLDDGMEQLARRGPILQEGKCNLYYIYYATLALHHYGSEHWDSWNSEVQNMLIQTQFRQGCESGSWYFPDAYCDSGGRLMNTALGAMILETPYRFMPLYREIR